MTNYEKQPPAVFYNKKMFLEILKNSQENSCARVSSLIKLQARCFLAQMFSCEFCETEHIRTTASEI